MKTQYIILIIVALLAVWYFFFRKPTAAYQPNRVERALQIANLASTRTQNIDTQAKAAILAGMSSSTSLPNTIAIP